MARERRACFLLAACALALLLGAATASAAPRYASPTGGGADPCASDLTPCPIHTAINMATGGDEVILLNDPAPYVTSTALTIAPGVIVRGETPGQAVLIQSDVSTGFPAIELSGNAILRDVRLEFTGVNGSAISMLGSGTLSRVFSHVSDSGTSSALAACEVLESTASPVISDSVCWYESVSTNGAAVEAFSNTGNAVNLTLRNVTAISDSPMPAIDASNNGGALDITGTNVIADGDSVDVQALQQVSGLVLVTLDHSNYDTESDPAGAGDEVTDPGTNANQTTPPAFLDAANGDFRQAQTSNGTLDKGITGIVNGVDLGPLDFEGGTRLQGPAPDIGADETLKLLATPIVAIPTSSPSTTTAVTKRRKRCRKGRKLRRGRCVKKKKKTTK